MKKFFFFLILYSANSCFGMKQGKIILINNGLLTKFEANIAHTGYRGAWWACCCCCVGSRKVFDITTKKDSLVNLMHHRHTREASVGFDVISFCPLLFEVSQEGTLIYHNLLNYSKKTEEAKEACRNNKAIYIAKELGVLIYSHHKQPSSLIYRQHKQTIMHYLAEKKANMNCIDSFHSRYDD